MVVRDVVVRPDLARQPCGSMPRVHPVDVLKNFLDPSRLAVAGALAVSRSVTLTLGELAERTALGDREVLGALGALRQGGLVVSEADGYRLDLDALRLLGQELAEVELPMDPVIGFGMSEEERRVLSRFFHGRTLHEVPQSRAKRLIVLERLAMEFDLGRRYPESEVNTILGRFHPDWSALRRHLVDEGFLDRDRNEYWRAGGRLGP